MSVELIFIKQFELRLRFQTENLIHLLPFPQNNGVTFLFGGKATLLLKNGENHFQLSVILK